MQRWHILIEYDGTDLVGLQAQAKGDSVQSLIETAIHAYSGERPRLHAAGRTDAGVHALSMSAHFDLMRPASPHEITGALNAYLRETSVVVLAANAVDEDFHARFSCMARHYEYHILNRLHPSILWKQRAWHVSKKLDISAMQQAAHLLIGQHDFSSFRAADCQANSPIKTLDRLDIEEKGEFIYVYASAKSFLHRQVRNMVGTLVEIGKGKYPYASMADILAGKDRKLAGTCAPAYGLYFVKADYIQS